MNVLICWGLKNKIKSWMWTAAGKASILLFVASIILLFLAMSSFDVPAFFHCSADMMNNIIIGIATNLVGIIVTISFVQYFLDKQDENIERKEEIMKIKRYNRYMQTLIKRYLMFYIAITTKIVDRGNIDISKAFDHKFDLSDMSDMYKPSLYMSDGLLEPAIVLFYKAEEKMCDYMMDMLENIDFKYNEGLYNILEEFLVKSSSFDMRGVILGNMKLHGEGTRKKLSDTIADDLANKSHDWLGMFKRNELSDNLIYPYACLYYEIQDQVKILKKYNNYIDSV